MLKKKTPVGDSKACVGPTCKFEEDLCFHNKFDIESHKETPTARKDGDAHINEIVEARAEAPGSVNAMEVDFPRPVRLPPKFPFAVINDPEKPGKYTTQTDKSGVNVFVNSYIPPDSKKIVTVGKNEDSFLRIDYMGNATQGVKWDELHVEKIMQQEIRAFNRTHVLAEECVDYPSGLHPVKDSRFWKIEKQKDRDCYDKYCAKFREATTDRDVAYSSGEHLHSLLLPYRSEDGYHIESD